jgi:2-phospho-L-lactate/phosphoenolpyruvate guanylyltransferase
VSPGETGVAAVIPVKPLDAALGRLSGVLPASDRRDLQWEMLGAVLSACAECEGLSRVVVVTGDATVGGLARAFGARVVSDHQPPRGMNAAVRIGCERVAAAGLGGALVLTADLPLIRPSDLEEIVARRPGGGEGVLCVPSRDGTGTNALLLCGPRVIEPQLGPDSLARHEAQARRRRVRSARLAVANLALDVDTPEDLAVLDALSPEWVDSRGAPEHPAAVGGMA